MKRCRSALPVALAAVAGVHGCGLVTSDPTSGSGGTVGAGAEGASTTGGFGGGSGGAGGSGNLGGSGGHGGRSATGGTGGPIDASTDANEVDAASDTGMDATPPACPPPGTLPADAGTPPSCAKNPICACGLSCCDTRVVPGGTFPMGRSLNGSDASSSGQPDELPEHPALVADFYLDTFEVTVARFREFVEHYPASLPQPGAGAHPAIPESGWRAEWNDIMPPTREKLEADMKCPATPGVQFETWTPAPGPYEGYPIICGVKWYTAFAFCAWDGGRLPTEAEWEYAAAGGDENRLLPWGSYFPGEGQSFETWQDFNQRYGCFSPDCFGSPPTTWGMGRWGQFALSGSVWEWVLDPPKPYTDAPCTHCASYEQTSDSAGLRGGAWLCYHPQLGAGVPHHCMRSAARGWNVRGYRDKSTGIRCARSP